MYCFTKTNCKGKNKSLVRAYNLTPTRISKDKSEGKYNLSHRCASHLVSWWATNCSTTISLCGKYRQSGTQSRALSHTLYIKLMWQNSGQEFSHSRGQLKLCPTPSGRGSLCFREAFQKTNCLCHITAGLGQKSTGFLWLHPLDILLWLHNSGTPSHVYCVVPPSCFNAKCCIVSTQIHNKESNLLGEFGTVFHEQSLSRLESSQTCSDLMGAGKDRCRSVLQSICTRFLQQA